MKYKPQSIHYYSSTIGSIHCLASQQTKVEIMNTFMLCKGARQAREIGSGQDMASQAAHRCIELSINIIIIR